MNILILNFSHLKFDVSTMDTIPLGGTESLVSHLARNLSKDGHLVTLMGHIDETTVMGVRHLPLSRLMTEDLEPYELCISVNLTTATRWIKSRRPDLRTVVWFHMMPDQPALKYTEQSLGSVDLAIYVSEAQKRDMEMYYGAAPKSVVIGNGLAPCFENLFASTDEILAAKECRGAYMTTPFRGLVYLADVAEKVDMKFDVFSSMKPYQSPDEEYNGLYERVKSVKNINYRDWAPQTELATALKGAAFYTYPCIFKETFCMSALEAMAAGAKVISTKLGALETTTMGFADLVDVDYVDSKNFVKGYTDQLKWNMAQFKAKPKEWAEKMFEQVKVVNENCTWDKKMKEWRNILA